MTYVTLGGNRLGSGLVSSVGERVAIERQVFNVSFLFVLF